MRTPSFLLELLAQADNGRPAGDGGEAPPGDGGGGPPPGFNWSPLIMIAIIFFIFWALLFRPEAKKRKERESKIAGIQKGDRVVTTGGILGKVTDVDESYVTVQLDDKKESRVRVLKWGVFDVLGPEGGDDSGSGKESS